MAALDGARKVYPRFDDAWLALTWLLARRGAAIHGAFHKFVTRADDAHVVHLYKQAGDFLAKTPDITVLFLETPNVIDILGARVTEPEPYVET